MLEEQCNIWDKYDAGEWICILTNNSTKLHMVNYVKSEPWAIMGRGIAKEAKDRFPELPARLGRLIVGQVINDTYLLQDLRLVIFPTKYQWHESSSIELIKNSCKMLVGYLNSGYMERVYLPRPGCGYGGLEWDNVKRYIEGILDDRVIVVWR